MFERSNDQVRRLIVLAQQQARLLNHNYIGTEHLLLGMLALDQEASAAAAALAALGIAGDKVHADVLEIIGQGQQLPTGDIPFTPRVKRVLELTVAAADRREARSAGTGHVLLGIADEGSGVAADVLRRHGATMDRVRDQLDQVLRDMPGIEPETEEQPAARASVRVARRAGESSLRRATSRVQVSGPWGLVLATLESIEARLATIEEHLSIAPEPTATEPAGGAAPGEAAPGEGS